MSSTPQPKEWVTVKEAGALVGRDKRQIYRWITQGYLPSRRSINGITEVSTRSVLRVEGLVKRGRPHGAAGPI